jgi:CheY-like chemotaxis protein
VSKNQLQALVVDDDPAIRKLTVLALSSVGFACETADSGAHAIEQIARMKFDLVITDLALPDGHGQSLAAELLALPDPPVIVVLTGDAEPQLVQNLLERGVDEIVIKPPHFRGMATKLKSLVDHRRNPGQA